LEYAKGLLVNREEGWKQLWVTVERNPALRDLHILFEKVFCSPATLASVERAFSTSRLFMRPHRARMGNRLLTELVMMKANLQKGRLCQTLCLLALGSDGQRLTKMLPTKV